MKIKHIISQNRRDFLVEFMCEHCGLIEKKTGYDDSYYHHNVIPKMQCTSCGKTAASDYRPLTTKYPDSEVI